MLLSCFAGLGYQIYQITEVYFRYPTTTRVTIVLIERFRSPSLHACFKYLDIIKLDELNEAKGTNFSRPWMSHEEEEFKKNLSVRDMFEFTDDRLMDCCDVRNPGRGNMGFYCGSECTDKISVKKFFHREFMCYRYDLAPEYHRNASYDLNQVSYTQYAQGKLFSIHINMSRIEEAHHITAFGQAHDTILLRSITMADFLLRIFNYTTRTETSQRNYIKVSFFTVFLYRMPPPYDTNCRDYGDNLVWLDLVNQCRNNLMMERLGKVHYHYPVFNGSLDFLPIQHTEYEDPWMYQKLREIKEECMRKIGLLHFNCKFGITVSQAYILKSPSFQVEIMAPKNIGFEVTHLPQIQFIDFFVYISSAIGTWFGFSFFTSTSGLFSYFCMSDSKVAATGSCQQQIRSVMSRQKKVELQMKENIRQMKQNSKYDNLMVVRNIEMMKVRIERELDKKLRRYIHEGY